MPGCILVKLKDNKKTLASFTPLEKVRQITEIDHSFAPVLSVEPVFEKNLRCSPAEKEAAQELDQWVKITVDTSVDILGEVEKYKQNPDVLYAQPNYIATTYVEPDDPYYHSSGSWGQDFPDLWGLYKISAESAWDITTGSQDVVVAVIDTGVDYNHPDIAANMWINKDEIPNNGIDDDHDGFVDNIYGADFVNGDGDPMDDHGHGTHCAGTIAAVGNNNLGVVGVNWQCKIMAVKGLNNQGSGYFSDLAAAMRWAADNGAKVLSNSWGADMIPSIPVIEDVVRYAYYSKGCIVVFAAGNSNKDVQYYCPQNMDEVITVAATDYQDNKASFSNWGSLVDVCAPGVDILSLRAAGTDMYGNGLHIVDENYYYASGTSMACPHVAGLVALLLAKNQSYTVDMIKYILSNAVDEVVSQKYIGGRINASKAILLEPAEVRFVPFPNPYNLQGIVNIMGTAWGENFLYYVVEYGKGKQPVSWTEITNSTVPVINEVLSSWDTTGIGEGTYSIRLRLICSDGTGNDTMVVAVNNAYNLYYVDDDNTLGPWDGTLEYPYRYIQDGIDATGYNDDIFVYSGTYFENVIIDRGITLTGENKETTIIDGKQASNVILISYDQVTVCNFSIQNSSRQTCYAGIYILDSVSTIITDNIIKNNNFGISVFGGSSSNIFENTWINNKYCDLQIFYGETTTITNNSFNSMNIGLGLSFAAYNIIRDNIFSNGGLFIQESYHNIISGNLVNGKPLAYFEEQSDITINNPNELGQIVLICCHNITVQNQILSNLCIGIILIDTDRCLLTSNTINSIYYYSIYLYNSSENIITGNIIQNEGGSCYGIDMRVSCCNNSISMNTISHTYYGIFIEMNNKDNIICGNTLAFNNYGIYINTYDTPFSQRNRIYHNNFLGNAHGNADDKWSNSWDDGYPSGGNYWSDYTGIDLFTGPGQNIPGSDGFGDTPYNISGGTNQDRYPFMQQNGWILNPPAQPIDTTSWNTLPQDKNKAVNSIQTEYTYTTSVTIGADLYFKFIWGDGQETSWLGPYNAGQPVSATHSWIQKGFFGITTLVKSGVDGTPSNPSAALTVQVYKVGDVNNDGWVTWRDIDPFVTAMNGNNAYYAAFPTGYYYTGDCNFDHTVNWRDIDPFVALMNT